MCMLFHTELFTIRAHALLHPSNAWKSKCDWIHVDAGNLLRLFLVDAEITGESLHFQIYPARGPKASSCTCNHTNLDSLLLEKRFL